MWVLLGTFSGGRGGLAWLVGDDVLWRLGVPVGCGKGVDPGCGPRLLLVSGWFGSGVFSLGGASAVVVLGIWFSLGVRGGVCSTAFSVSIASVTDSGLPGLEFVLRLLLPGDGGDVVCCLLDGVAGGARVTSA